MRKTLHQFLTNPATRKGLGQLLSEYGMVLVLLLLCLFFSLVTISEQAATGAAAARQVAKGILQAHGEDAQVLIATSVQPEDLAFAEQMDSLLGGDEVAFVAEVRGDPRDAREAILKLLDDEQRLDAIACSETAASWLLFADLQADFPGLGNPQVYQPRSYLFPKFLKRDNLLNIANQIAVIAIVAIGMTMVIIAGGIDLSVGSLIALSAVLTALFIQEFAGAKEATAFGMLLCSLAAILLCGGLGGFSGVMVTRFGIPPFIGTLAMMLIASGLAYIFAKGQSVGDVPESFVWLGRRATLGLPNAVLLMLFLYAIAHVVMSRRILGRHLYAVGGNREAARLSGVPVGQVTCISYIASGLLAGLGGVILASQYQSGSPTYGNMYELYVIAAVVVGGTSLSGGEGKMLGTLIGAFTIAVIQNGMNLTNVESYTQKVVLGLVILGAVLLDRLRHR